MTLSFLQILFDCLQRSFEHLADPSACSAVCLDEIRLDAAVVQNPALYAVTQREEQRPHKVIVTFLEYSLGHRTTLLGLRPTRAPDIC